MTEIKPLLLKKKWVRRSYDTKVAQSPVSISASEYEEMQPDTFMGVTMSQSDFMNELHPSAHKIHSSCYRSLRAVYEFDEATQKPKIKGYEQVERVDVGLNEATVRHKVTTVAGNDIWFQPEGDKPGNEDLVSMIKSYWIRSGMKHAFLSICRSLFATGDAAIYLYVDENDSVKYRVFSFENGEVFNMTYNELGERVFVRRFNLEGVDMVEVYDKTNISVWAQKKDETFLGKIEKFFKGKGKVIERSSDGYECIQRVAHGFGRIPVVYFRSSDVVWGPGQKSIERIERLLSDLAENNKYYAYQILFTSGGLISLPPSDSMGKVIASESPDGKAEILKPADASNTFTIDLEKNLDMLCETLALVIINPKDLKAGENTGAFIKNLYWREVQWAINTFSEIYPTMCDLLDLFKIMVSKAENKADYSKASLSMGFEPCVPQNLSEEIQNIATAKNAGITSIETAAGEIPFNNPREYEKLQREAKEKSEADEAAKKLQAELNANTNPPQPGNDGEGANNQGK